MIPAVEADLPEIEAFLQRHVEWSMFPLINIRDYGWDGDAPYAMRFWLRRDGQITDVLGVSNAGGVMPQCPTGPWAEVAEVLRGMELDGVIGPADQARAIIAVAGVQDAPSTLDRDEPFMRLGLADLVVPDGPGQIVSIAEVDPAPVLEWMKTYQREALHTPEANVHWRAEGSLARYRERRSHVVLMEGDEMLAMTGFNATLPNIVQIGGVFTPADRRGHGHARRAVALHLAQAREDGVERAVLFSASEMANRAYAAIGFVQDGEWTLRLFDPKVRVG